MSTWTKQKMIGLVPYALWFTFTTTYYFNAFIHTCLHDITGLFVDDTAPPARLGSTLDFFTSHVKNAYMHGIMGQCFIYFRFWHICYLGKKQLNEGQPSTNSNASEKRMTSDFGSLTCGRLETGKKQKKMSDVWIVLVSIDNSYIAVGELTKKVRFSGCLPSWELAKRERK